MANEENRNTRTEEPEETMDTRAEPEQTPDAPVESSDDGLPPEPEGDMDADYAAQAAAEDVQSEVDGIAFADEGSADDAYGKQKDKEKALSPDERARAKEAYDQNSAVAKDAFARMRHMATKQQSRKEEKPVVARLSPEEAAKKAPKLYRVLEQEEITRGASSYVLKKGKIISNRDYDIPALEDQGVKLEEYRPRAKTAQAG